MPRYRENPLIIKSSMLCPGISQNTKHHHLTLYKGQVWREKPYLELCDQNMLNIAYDPYALVPVDYMVEWNGVVDVETSVPPLPGQPFERAESQIPFDSEMIQSFAQLTKITRIEFLSYEGYGYEDETSGFESQIRAGSFNCIVIVHHELCVHATNYFPKYIFTKEGLKIQIQKFSILL